MKLNDFYCAGYFGRRYDLYNANIVGVGNRYIVVQPEEGCMAFAEFDNEQEKEEFIEAFVI